MRYLSELLARAVAVIPLDLRDEIVVFGSAPMVFAGLKADVTFDLDLFASDGAYSRLIAADFVEDTDERGCVRVMLAPAIEVVSAWPGVTFADVLAASAIHPASLGLRVASLAHVLAFKSISARDKDIAEAAILRRNGVT